MFAVTRKVGGHGRFATMEENMSDSMVSNVLGEESFWDVPLGQAKPFLRWAGGKGWLASLLREEAPESFNTFIEPFLGSGVVLFSVGPAVKRKGSDLNSELINTFETVRDRCEALVTRLQMFSYSESAFLDARSIFNTLKKDPLASKTERAALFIYLNKCSFNGLYRENADGNFNVPWGQRKAAPVNLESLLRRASANLRGNGPKNRSEFSVGDYLDTLRDAGSGDWVYLDPPYSPASKTANFVGYTATGFDANQQTLLRDEAESAVERGALVTLSNADTSEVRELYGRETWRLREVNVRRSVGAQSATRKKAPEVLITSYG